MQDLSAKLDEVDPNLLMKETAAIAAYKSNNTAPENGPAKGKQAAPAAIEEEGFAAPVFAPSTQPVTNFGGTLIVHYICYSLHALTFLFSCWQVC